MEHGLQIAVESQPDPADMHVIIGGLSAYNASHAGGDTPRYFLVTIRDREGKVVGGLMGATYLGWTQVSALWMPDALRGQGIGTELMARAEDLARERGCPRM